MRRTRYGLPLAALLLTAIAWPLPGHSEPVVASFNVRDFGAKGDGVADDTQAIQAAVDAAGKKAISEQPPESAYYFSLANVLFPQGKYLISDTITVGAANLVGEGNTVISLPDPAKDIFSGTYVWRWRISGFTFLGGKDQLHLGNPNIDSGKINVEYCAFYKAAGIAIHLLKGSNSTQMTGRECIFMGCKQALVNWCDYARLTDSWVSSSPKMKDQAVFENRSGTLFLENVCGVPAVVAENDQRWIDNWGLLTCRSVRFGGEGAGFTPVVNWGSYGYTYPVGGPVIVLDNCVIYSNGNQKRRAAVYLEAIPNQIIVRNCNGFCDMPVVKVSDSLDLNTAFDNAEKRGPQTLRFAIDKAQEEICYPNGELPEQMRPYQADEIVAEAPPKTGIWHRGTFIRNRNFDGKYTAQGFVLATTPALQEPYGWYCVAPGKPGGWQAVYFTSEKPALPAAAAVK